MSTTATTAEEPGAEEPTVAAPATMKPEFADAMRNAGAAELAPGAQAWLADRLARFGYNEPALNLGGLRCAHAHDHAEPGLCLADGARQVAVFASVGDSVAALVDTALRAGASAERPADALEGFRSMHVAGDAPEPDAEARRFRRLTADWEAFERAGVSSEHWRSFRDAWRTGSAGNLAPEEDRADAVRASLAAGVSGFLDPMEHPAGLPGHPLGHGLPMKKLKTLAVAAGVGAGVVAAGALVARAIAAVVRGR